MKHKHNYPQTYGQAASAILKGVIPKKSIWTKNYKLEKA